METQRKRDIKMGAPLHSYKPYFLSEDKQSHWGRDLRGLFAIGPLDRTGGNSTGTVSNYVIFMMMAHKEPLPKLDVFDATIR